MCGEYFRAKILRGTLKRGGPGQAHRLPPLKHTTDCWLPFYSEHQSSLNSSINLGIWLSRQDRVIKKKIINFFWSQEPI